MIKRRPENLAGRRLEMLSRQGRSRRWCGAVWKERRVATEDEMELEMEESPVEPAQDW
jgi:hypothetical protein